MKDIIQKVPTLKHNMGPFTIHEGINRTGGKMVGVYNRASASMADKTAANQRHMLGVALHEIQHAVWQHAPTDRKIQGIKICCGDSMVVAEIELAGTHWSSE